MKSVATKDRAIHTKQWCRYSIQVFPAIIGGSPLAECRQKPTMFEVNGYISALLKFSAQIQDKILFFGVQRILEDQAVSFC
jgi:hypothetical protein